MKVPKKVKKIFKRFQEDWSALNPLEKTAVIATGIFLSKGLDLVATDALGRFEHRKKLERVI